MFGLVMIVKDEEAMLPATLASIRPHIDHWTIVDTGSTDRTREVVLEALDGIPGFLHEHEFTTFGETRSWAFAQARGMADWLLALDADMTLEIDQPLHLDPAVDAYMVGMGSADFSYRLPLVLRGDLPWESRGAVHEYTTLPDRAYVSAATDAIRVSYPHDRSSREKSLWHARLLEAELAEHPDDARSVFYLAQTYRDLGDPRALSMYERRARMPGWVEETFYAKYRHALLLPSWPARMMALLAAWEFRPSRLEPAHELARELNYRGLHQAAYRFASIDVEPTSDVLFVHRSAWDWGMAFERSIAAWWLGKWDEFDSLTAALLDNPGLPDHIREAVIRNQGCERAA